MKLIFTTAGNDLDALLDPSFGRARNFLLYDLDSGTSQVISNQQNLNAAQGAGIQSAQRVAGTGAQALVSGHCGPKAFAVLQAAGIKVYTSNAQTIADALKAYQDGQLDEIKSADVEGHWM